MSWFWIGVAVAAPTVAGFLMALPFWWSRHATAGNIAGASIMLFGAAASILREYVVMLTQRMASLKAGKLFQPSPDEFTRYAIYAGIGFAEVFLLFLVGLSIEERLRRRDRAREWR